MKGVGICLVIWIATAHAQTSVSLPATGNQATTNIGLNPAEVNPAVTNISPQQPRMSLLQRTLMDRNNRMFSNLYNQQMNNGAMRGGYNHNQGQFGMGYLPWLMVGGGDGFRQAALFSMMSNQGQGNTMLPWMMMNNGMDSPLALMALMGGGMGGGGGQRGGQGTGRRSSMNPLMMFSMHEMMN